MKRVLVLGATGRSGSAVISHLSGRVEIVAGLHTEVDRSRLPGDACITGTALIDLASIASLQRAMRDMDAVHCIYPVKGWPRHGRISHYPACPLDRFCVFQHGKTRASKSVRARTP